MNFIEYKIHLNHNISRLLTFDENKVEAKYKIESLNDIYKYANEILFCK